MKNNERAARIFKAFCDPNRLFILSLLQTGEKCACELLESLKIGQPTLSNHMRILCDADIVRSSKHGKYIVYQLDKAGVEHAKMLLAQITEIKANEPSVFLRGC